MWKPEKQAFVTGFQFEIDGEKEKFGNSFKETEPEIFTLEEGDFVNRVDVSFANDPDLFKGEFEVTEITFGSNSGSEAHCKGKWKKELKQRKATETGLGRAQIVGVRGRYHKGYLEKNINKLVHIQFCWAPADGDGYYFYVDDDINDDDDDEKGRDGGDEDEVVPAVKKKETVEDLTGDDLEALKSMKNPHDLVKKTVYAVCLLQKKTKKKGKTWGWSDSQKVLGDGGITLGGMMKFNADAFKKENKNKWILTELNQMFKSDTEWTYGNVSAESETAGVLFKWIESVHRVIPVDDEEKKQETAPKQKKMSPAKDQTVNSANAGVTQSNPRTSTSSNAANTASKKSGGTKLHSNDDDGIVFTDMLGNINADSNGGSNEQQNENWTVSGQSTESTVSSNQQALHPQKPQHHPSK